MPTTVTPIFRHEDDETILVALVQSAADAEWVLTRAVPPGEESLLMYGTPVRLYYGHELPAVVEAIRQQPKAQPVTVESLDEVHELIERHTAPVSSRGVGVDGKPERGRP